MFELDVLTSVGAVLNEMMSFFFSINIYGVIVELTVSMSMGSWINFVDVLCLL